MTIRMVYSTWDHDHHCWLKVVMDGSHFWERPYSHQMLPLIEWLGPWRKR